MRVNINTASAKELETLNGVGPALAQKIIAHRKKQGRFQSLEELKEVSGVSNKLLAKNRTKLALTNSAAAKKSPRKSRKTLTDQALDYFSNWMEQKVDNFLDKKSDKQREKALQKKVRAKIVRRKVITPSKASKTTKKENSKPTITSRTSSSKQLSAQQIKETADQLKVDSAAIRAVLEVESSGGGFLKNGKPKILFEGHIFWTQLQAKGINPKRHLKGNEDILYPRWTRKHYKGGAREHERLERAKRIHESAALASASWGLFQVMGFNYHMAGFRSVEAFVAAQYESEQEHLNAFLGYIKSRKLIRCLRQKNWARFAAGYNGKDYRKNRYDERLAAAYKKHSKQ